MLALPVVSLSSLAAREDSAAATAASSGVGDALGRADVEVVGAASAGEASLAGREGGEPPPRRTAANPAAASTVPIARLATYAQRAWPAMTANSPTPKTTRP